MIKLLRHFGPTNTDPGNMNITEHTYTTKIFLGSNWQVEAEVEVDYEVHWGAVSLDPMEPDGPAELYIQRVRIVSLYAMPACGNDYRFPQEFTVRWAPLVLPMVKDMLDEDELIEAAL